MSFFFFNDTATTEIYTLSLHDALPILLPADTSRVPMNRPVRPVRDRDAPRFRPFLATPASRMGVTIRSEEHTSELQSRQYLVCRLLLEKKKKLLLCSSMVLLPSAAIS